MEKGINREINEPMAQEPTLGQYQRKAPETSVNQDEEVMEIHGPGSSLLSVSSSGVSEPIPPHVLPPHNWHMSINTQRARDGEIRNKGDSSIKDQGPRSMVQRPHTI